MAAQIVNHLSHEGLCKEFSKTIEVEEENDFVLITFKNAKFENFSETLRLHKSFFCSPGKPVLHQAIRNSCSDAILPLVRAGCDIMTRDSIHQDTPLHVACFYCQIDVIVFLMQQGAAVNALNNAGQTPLDKLLLLCHHPSKDSRTRLRLLTAHLLTRLGFKVNPRAQGQSPGTRSRVLVVYNKAKTCFDCPSLLHICRLRVRDLLPDSNHEPIVKSLSLPVDLHNFLLFRPFGLDHHVMCSHTEGLVHHSQT